MAKILGTDITTDTYTAGASQTDFDITFPFLRPEHLRVEVDNVVKTLDLDYYVDFSESDGIPEIVFTTGMTGGESVEIDRVTILDHDVEGGWRKLGTRATDYIVYALQEVQVDLDAVIEVDDDAPDDPHVGMLWLDTDAGAVSGGGDVVGPDGAVDENIVIFDGTSGTLIKDSGYGVDDLGANVTVQDSEPASPDTGDLWLDTDAGAVSGGGDVVGPSSATDTAVCLFDGTSGTLIKNSAVLIDGSGNITPGGSAQRMTGFGVAEVGTSTPSSPPTGLFWLDTN